MFFYGVHLGAYRRADRYGKNKTAKFSKALSKKQTFLENVFGAFRGGYRTIKLQKKFPILRKRLKCNRVSSKTLIQ